MWSKNRPEWLTTLLAMNKVRTVCIGFFDAMGPETVEFIANQTEIVTLFVSDEFMGKVLDMMENKGMLK